MPIGKQLMSFNFYILMRGTNCSQGLIFASNNSNFYPMFKRWTSLQFIIWKSLQSIWKEKFRQYLIISNFHLSLSLSLSLFISFFLLTLSHTHTYNNKMSDVLGILHFPIEFSYLDVLVYNNTPPIGKRFIALLCKFSSSWNVKDFKGI
jgi:hypothetical protein